MKKPAVGHDKAHKSPQWRTGARSSRPGFPLPEFRYRPEFVSGTAANGTGPGGAGPGRHRSRSRVSLLRGKSLNWTLRRYVRASSLRVWLRRQAPGAGGAPVPAGRDGPLRTASRQAGTAREARCPASGERLHGVSLSRDHLLRYRIHRNRQMEHLTQVAVSLRGGVRRGAAITPRERAAAQDLVLTTLSDKMYV
jgi:hypothetical protein